MIKYFEELENRENQILPLIEESSLKAYPITIETLPLEYCEKYKDVFLELSRLNILAKINDEKINYFTEKDVLSYMDFKYFVESYESHDNMDFVLTKDGKNKLDFLVSKICLDPQEIDYDDCLYIYLEAVVSLFELDGVIIKNRAQIAHYLDSSMTVLKYQKRLSDKLKKRLSEALKEINKYHFEIPLKPYTPYNLKLPNAWYITPYKHLYNSMGKDGHKEANLFYPFYYTILRDKENPNPRPYLKAAQKKLNQEKFVTYNEYCEFLNLIYDFPYIYPDFYYNLNPFLQTIYRYTDRRSYNPTLVRLIAGILSAHAGLYNFFYQLKKYSNTYEQNLTFLKSLDFNDMLVRCCRFHKITSLPDKIITTSLISCEEEFREYIKKGWKIDFLPPFILNEQGLLEEYPEEFLTIRKILK